MGFLILFVGISYAATALGIHWLVALGIGLPVSLVLTNVLAHLAQRVLPRPPRLDPHEVHIESASLKELADILELIASPETWTNDLDRRIVVLSKSLDDLLYDAALEAAQQYRDTLTGNPPPKKSKGKIRPGLAEQREELRAIARDLRLAARGWPP